MNASSDAAVAAYRSGAQTFPDGAMIVRVAWAYASSEENNRSFGREQSFVAGEPTNIQLMIKDTGDGTISSRITRDKSC